VVLSPRHLVVCGASGGVVGPSRAGVATQLLHSEKSLLHLCAVQEPKHGLNHLKPVICLERLSCLSEERWVSGREVTIGGRSWSGDILCPIATTSRVGHKLPQQLDSLISGLKNRSDSLSQGRWRRRVPVRLRVLGLSPSITSVHHSVIQTHYH
jgi:hypothetical protein